MAEAAVWHRPASEEDCRAIGLSSPDPPDPHRPRWWRWCEVGGFASDAEPNGTLDLQDPKTHCTERFDRLYWIHLDRPSGTLPDASDLSTLAELWHRLKTDADLRREAGARLLGASRVLRRLRTLGRWWDAERYPHLTLSVRTNRRRDRTFLLCTVVSLPPSPGEEDAFCDR